MTVDRRHSTVVCCVMEPWCYLRAVHGPLIHHNTETEMEDGADGAQLFPSRPRFDAWLFDPDRQAATGRTGSRDQTLLVESRPVSPATGLERARRHVLQQPPFALSRAASAKSWRRHGFKAPDYRWTGARSGEGKRQDGSMGGRTPNRILLPGAECRSPGGPGLDRADEGRLDRCRDAGCRRPSGIGVVHNGGRQPTRSVGRS